jgi:hypothetical protein
VGLGTSDEHKRRMLEVLQRRAFAHELRIDRHREPRDRFSDLLAQYVGEHLFSRPWQYCAAQHDGQRTFARTETAPDVGAHVDEAVEIRMSSAFVRCSDADEREIGVAEGIVC